MNADRRPRQPKAQARNGSSPSGLMGERPMQSDSEADSGSVARIWPAAPAAMLPDETLALLCHLNLSSRHLQALRREMDLRRGSDRSGPRLAIRADEYLRMLDEAEL
jgi:hypothetical protein